MFKLFRKAYGSKGRSEKRLSELGIACNKNLPILESINRNKSRNAIEIAHRIIALWEVVNNATNDNSETKEESVSFFKEMALWDDLPESEKSFLGNESVDEQRVIDLTWRSEALKVLYWSIGEIDELGKPIEEKNLLKVNEAVLSKYPTVESFIEGVRVRKSNEIYDEADFIYRLHWCSRSYRRVECRVPKEYEYSVIYERDFTLRWILQKDVSWDDITCDT